MRTLRRSWKNVFRNPGRTTAILLLLGLSVAMFATMLQAGAATSAQVAALSAQVETLIEVSPSGSSVFEEGIDLFADTVVDEMGDIPNIVKLDRYLITRLVDLSRNPTIAFFTGAAPDAPIRLAGSSVVDPPLIAGRTLAANDVGQKVALIGQVFAAQEGIAVTAVEQNQRPRFTITPPGLPLTEIEVIGIFESGTVFGDNQVILPLDTAQQVFELPGQISLLLVTADSVENVTTVAAALREVMGDRADVLASEELVQLAAQSFSSIQATSRFGAALSAFLGGVVVVFSMILVIGERTSEIGMIKAIGASDGQVAGGLLAEVALLAGLGGLVGLALAALAGPIITNLILDSADVAVSGFSLALVGNVLGAVLLLALLGSLYPLIKTLRMEPAEAMRHQK
jgi:putative ABC transport system permease protein